LLLRGPDRVKRAKEPWYKSLEAINPRVYVLVILILATIPIFKPIGIPFPLEKHAEITYKYIDALPKGTVVLWDFCLSRAGVLIGGRADQFVMLHLLRKGCKLVIVTLLEEAPVVVMGLISEIRPQIEEIGAVYGKDWVYYGFIPGEEVVMSGIFSDAHKVLVKEYYQGTPTTGIPMMKDIKDVNSFNLLIVEEYTPKMWDAWIRQGPAKYGIPTIYLAAGPPYMPYYPALLKAVNQPAYLLAGYEYLTGKPGRAVITTDAYTLANIWSLAMILIGNMVYLVGRRERSVKRA